MKFNKVTGDHKRDLISSRGMKNDLNFARFVHDVFVARESMSHFFKFWRALMQRRPSVRDAPTLPSSRRPLRANDYDVGEHASREIWHVSREKWGELFTDWGPWRKNEKQVNCVVYPAFGDELTFGKGSTNETGNVPTTWHRVLITGECFYRCLGDKHFIFVPWGKRTGRKSTSSGWVRIQKDMILSRAVEMK